MGSNWFGSNWFGSNWFGSNWSGPSANVPVFAMRTDRPLAELPHWKVPPDFGAKFRDHDWDPDLLALTILPEFVVKQIGGQTWDQSVVLPAPSNITQAILDDLAVLAVTERPEAIGEIVQQHQNFQLCWLQLLNIDFASHPSTFFVMKLAARVGELTMMVLKRRHPKRPRPSQIWPTLYPPVPVPGHAPYPAGHALIGRLTSECLAEVAPQHKDALYELAKRCGMNRVYAGLHFREDIAAGEQAATQIHRFVKQCGIYQAAVAQAKNEWL
jgi:hypothetical protein